MKQSTKDTIKKLYLYAKLITVLVLISAVTYGIGTFMPNPIAVKKATEETRVQHAIWAEKLGLHEPSFEYTNKPCSNEHFHSRGFPEWNFFIKVHIYLSIYNVSLARDLTSRLTST